MSIFLTASVYSFILLPVQSVLSVRLYIMLMCLEYAGSAWSWVQRDAVSWVRVSEGTTFDGRHQQWSGDAF